jgi:hypothetical protein
MNYLLVGLLIVNMSLAGCETLHTVRGIVVEHSSGVSGAPGDRPPTPVQGVAIVAYYESETGIVRTLDRTSSNADGGFDISFLGTKHLPRGVFIKLTKDGYVTQQVDFDALSAYERCQHKDIRCPPLTVQLPRE